MSKFETGKVYAVTMLGRVSKTNLMRVVSRSAKFVTFRNIAAERNGFINETERVKIRGNESVGESAIVFGGIVSDSVYSRDEVLV